MTLSNTPVRVTVVHMADVSKFDSGSIAGTYAAARPSYPAELFDTLDGLLAGRLNGARVVDVAAGMGSPWSRPDIEDGSGYCAPGRC